MSSSPKIQSFKYFSNSQLIRSVSGDNLVLYFTTISGLRLQQETKWVSINFEKKDLTSGQKNHPLPSSALFG